MVGQRLSKTYAGGISNFIDLINDLVVDDFETEVLGHVNLGPVVAVKLQFKGGRRVLAVVVTIVKASPDKNPLAAV